jgi:copper homeostasis protein
MPDILLEICCGSIDDAIEAQRGGADRVELCSALFLGGLTPSLGTLQEAKARLKIPVIVMVRPRSGGFCYTDAEFATMERDAALAIEHGADGVVFGILKRDGAVDLERTRRIRELIGLHRQAVFHRAFDVTPEPLRAVDQLVDLGITRILTSGQENTVAQGVGLIRAVIEHARGRIEIMPGGGIMPHEIAMVIERTGCTQIHLTAWRTQPDPSTENRPQVTFGGALYPPENSFQMADSALVARLAALVKTQKQ